MAIYINGRFLEKKLTGIQRYAMEITQQLDKLNVDEEIYLLKSKKCKYNLKFKTCQYKKRYNRKFFLLYLPISFVFLFSSLWCIHSCKILYRSKFFFFFYT